MTTLRASLMALGLNSPLEDLNLSEETLYPLKRVGLETVRDLIGKRAGDLAAIPNYRPIRIREVEDALASHGLSLRP